VEVVVAPNMFEYVQFSFNSFAFFSLVSESDVLGPNSEG
jgi:hypothetical protein